MNRRKVAIYASLATLLAVIIVTLILVKRPSQSSGDVKKVAIFLHAQHPVIAEISEGFQARLNELAKIRKSNVQYSVMNADGDSTQSNSIATSLIGRKFNLIFVVGIPAAQSLNSARVSTPVIFGGPPDPVAAGLVPSLVNHGTNFTGTKYFPPVGLSIDLFKEAFPESKQLAVIHNPGEANSMAVVGAFLREAKLRNIEVRDMSATNATELDSVLRALAVDKPDGIFLPTDNLIYSSLDRIISLMSENSIPIFNCTRLSVDKGALFSIATDYRVVGALSADMAGEILFDGKSPSDLDVMEISQGTIYTHKEFPKKLKEIPTGYNVVLVD